MAAKVIALTGISGVGKSTLVRTLAASIPLEHLQASALIAEGRNVTGIAITQDQLRLIDIDENQRFLVEGFKRKTKSSSGLVILDGHTVIEKDNELILVRPAVFQAICISGMVFLADNPSAIAERRRCDESRKRPLESIEEIRRIQEIAQEHAIAICRFLSIELYVYRPDEIAAITAIIQRLRLAGNISI
ncbi:ATP-binding protein [Microbaculum marinisediminis]|uniref:AAA family ATPase n=1 Tax=Microbaculum marinisediminis TaxID=2931392 RepID=A0AAW5QWE3_9HYPH|nr:AAA family ATPase [Microbaculum sp. A6E488]MCT8970708.1 AAA family ATPase [Microbaculum sp. A6E488]